MVRLEQVVDVRIAPSFRPDRNERSRRLASRSRSAAPHAVRSAGPRTPDRRQPGGVHAPPPQAAPSRRRGRRRRAASGRAGSQPNSASTSPAANRRSASPALDAATRNGSAPVRGPALPSDTCAAPRIAESATAIRRFGRSSSDRNRPSRVTSTARMPVAPSSSERRGERLDAAAEAPGERHRRSRNRSRSRRGRRPARRSAPRSRARRRPRPACRAPPCRPASARAARRPNCRRRVRRPGRCGTCRCPRASRPGRGAASGEERADAGGGGAGDLSAFGVIRDRAAPGSCPRVPSGAVAVWFPNCQRGR